MRKIFLDEELNNSFLASGYVVVDLLNTEQLTDLLKLYAAENFPATGNFYLTIWKDEPKHRLMIHDSIQKIISSSYNMLLNDYKPVVSSFAVKQSAPDSAWHPHQDDTFVDEKKYISLSIWIPLCDIDSSVGALQVSSGSHKIYTGPRSPNIPPPFKHQIDEIQLKDIEMKAGQAIIFDHRLVHASGPNNSGKIRTAVVTILIPSEADLTYLYLDNSVKPEIIKQYKISERYYLEAPLGEFSKEPDSSQYELLATYPYIEEQTNS